MKVRMKKLTERSITTMLSLLVFFVPIAGAQIVVDIPDENLEAAIREELGISPSDPITETDLLDLTFLDASLRGITDLTGLQYCMNLTNLRLPLNNINDINALSGLTNLQRLWLQGNNISDISALSGLTNLWELDIDNNNISDISALSGLTNLQVLWLQRNNISDISALSGLTNLAWLLLDDNNISNISALSGLTNLWKLILSHNNISNISALSGLTNLEQLLITSNNISDISALSGLTNLSWLYLTSNNIADIHPLVDNPGLNDGDLVYLNSNPLGYKAIYIDIPVLQSRGVNVYFDEPSEPKVVAIWSGPEPADVVMHGRYRINVSIFSEEFWPGGTVKLKLIETLGSYPSDKWNSGNNELLNDVGDWDVYYLPVFGDAPICIDEDYKVGIEYVELYVPPGGHALPIANLYFEGSHKWAWIPPVDFAFIQEWMADLILGSALGDFGSVFSTWLTALSHQRILDSSVSWLMYFYTGCCEGTCDNDFGTVKITIPLWKYFVLAQSTGFIASGSVPTLFAINAIASTGGLAIHLPPVQLALISEAAMLAASRLLYTVAADPPDMDYKIVALPVPIQLDEIHEIGFPKFRRAALMALELEATVRAFKESMEKYEGARLDGAIQWQAIQLAAAKHYMWEAQHIIEELANFWEGVVSEFTVPTPSEIEQARNWLNENGFPMLEVSALLKFGYTQEEIDQLAAMAASADDSFFRGINELPGLLRAGAEGFAEIADHLPQIPSDVASYDVALHPGMLNMSSSGKWITLYIEAPEGHDVSEIDVSSLKLQNSIDVESQPTEIGDYDNDGIHDLMVKFDRQELIEILGPESQIVTLTGQLSDGTPFASIDVIRVKSNKKNETDEPESDSAMSEEVGTDLEEDLQIMDFDSAMPEEFIAEMYDDNSDIDTYKAFDPEEAAAFMLFEAGGIIGELGPESFKNEESAFELACAIDDVFTMLDEGMYFESLVLLEDDILQRTDGCVSIGEPDEDDWITSIEGQALLYPLVTETIELLETLL